MDKQMQRALKYSMFWYIFLTTIISCTNKYEFGSVRISDTIIPDTVKVNETVKLLIKAEANNGCWSDLQIDFAKKDLFEYSIQAFGKFSGCRNCDCPDVMVYKDFEVDFQPLIKGVYRFHIKDSMDNAVVDSMIVD